MTCYLENRKGMKSKELLEILTKINKYKIRYKTSYEFKLMIKISQNQMKTLIVTRNWRHEEKNIQQKSIKI